MPSAESQAMEDLYRRAGKILGTQAMDIDLFRVVSEDICSVGAEPTDVTYTELQCPGTDRPAIWCSPSLASPSRIILFMHGGGFMSGSPSSHRKLAAHLAKGAGTQALIVDYRRAPEHQFPTQIDDIISTYRWLLEKRGFSSKDIVFAGDSAGGNLTLSVALAAKKQNLEMPAAIVMFSPWLDMRMTGNSWKANAQTDVCVQLEAMQGVCQAYLGGASLDDPLVDLLHANLEGFPPMYLTVGGAEVLQDDAAMLAKNAKLAGVEVQLDIAEGMQHIWVMMAGNAPEADRTLSQAANFIRDKIATR